MQAIISCEIPSIEMRGNGFLHSHSLSFPSIQFPVPPVPIPIHAAVQLYITTVHYRTGVTSSSIQYRNPNRLLSMHIAH